MRLITGLRDNVARVAAYLESGAAVKEHLEPKSEEIMALQRARLMDGKRPDGSDIRPYYSEDRYFPTPARAEAYKAWKQEITPNPRRNPEAPNLYINGKFHSELGVSFEPDGVEINGKTGYAIGIVRKYGMDSFGLPEDEWGGLIREELPKIRKRITQIIYG